MKIGLASTCLWKLKPEELVLFAVENDIYSIEFWIDHLRLFDTTYKNIRKILKENGIVSTIHSVSWDINICSFSKKVRDFSLHEIMKSIDIAEEIGAKIVVVHPGKMSFERAGRELYIDILVESFSRIYNYAYEKDIKLCIENMEPSKKELLVTWEDFFDFYKRIDNSDKIYIAMDLAHLGSSKRIKGFYRNLSDKIIHMHISDLNKKQIHIPLGRGNLPFKRILKLLGDGYSGIYNIEFFSYDDNNNDVKNSIKFLKDLLIIVERR